MADSSVTHMLSKARTLHQGGQLGDAEALYQLILMSEPEHAETLGLLGTLDLQRGRLEDGVRLLQKSLAIKPRQGAVLANLGEALLDLQRPQEALVQFDALVALKPKETAGYLGRAKALRFLQRPDAAVAAYGKALTLQPDSIFILMGFANMLQELRRYEEALVHYGKVIRLKPDHSGAYNNSSIALVPLMRFDEALAANDKAIALKPDSFEAYINRVSVLQALGRFDEALASSEKAVALQPNHPEAHNSRGVVLQKMHRYPEALASFDRACGFAPPYAQAFFNKGNMLREQKRYDEALESYEKAQALNPEIPTLAGNILYTMLHSVAWEGLDGVYADITKGIESGRPLATPFSIIASPFTAAQQKTCAEIFARHTFPPGRNRLWNGEKYTHGKIRLGYFSADFHNHATSHLMAELFELHDREAFEVTAFSFGRQVHDSMRARIEKTVDRFVDVSAQSDLEIGELARSMEIDIACDLKGFSQDMRAGIFTRRIAPVQVNYLVFPATMGAPYMDYIIADKVLIPEGHDAFYSEKVVRLPDSYQANDTKKVIAPLALTRAQAGLPDKGFVFCCFNNTYKITPDVFAVWMRLLQKVEGSVLWLLEGSALSRARLYERAGAHGIAPQRLVFAGRADLPDHLARHALADLFLDTFYCNAHTTASDSLWAGLPLLTCIGGTFAARVAASLLHAAGLPEMVADTQAHYEARALELASNPAMLAAIRSKLKGDLRATALFNMPLYTRHLETAFTRMRERTLQGLPPEAITVNA